MLFTKEDTKTKEYENNEEEVSCSRCKTIPSVLIEKSKEAAEFKDLTAMSHALLCNRNASKSSDVETLIHQIFEDGHSSEEQIIEILTFFFENGVDIHSKNEAGHTVFHLAIKNRWKQVIDFLLTHGASFELTDYSGNLIVHFLIESEFYKLEKCNMNFDLESLQKKSTDFIRFIIQKGLDVDYKNKNGDTALHLAAKFNLLHALLLLLEHTKDTTICNNSKVTAFQIFAKSVVLVEKLSDKLNTKTNSEEIRPLPTSHYEPVLVDEIFMQFLKKGYSVNVVDESGSTPVHYALKQWRRDIALIMLPSLTNVNACDGDGNTLLHIVINYLLRYKHGIAPEEYEAMACLLLQKGADITIINRQGSSPLLTAIKFQLLPVLLKFEKCAINFSGSCKNTNVLHYFCKVDQVTDYESYQEIFNLLIDQGCDVNAKDSEGFPLLYRVTQNNKKDLVERLIKSGADVNCKEPICGFTPFLEVSLCSNSLLMKVLIENGADVNATSDRGETALHVCDNEELVKKLVEYGVHVDTADKEGFLPLHTAIRRHDVNYIKKLIRFGADINESTHVLRKEEYEWISGFISVHVIKLYVAELPVHDSFKYFVTFNENSGEFHENCLKEISSLKNFKITNSKSLYDFLHCKRNSTCNYIDNEKLKESVNSSTLEKQFPMYHDLISSTYYMAISRKKWLKPAKEALQKLISISLPELCLHEICFNLRNSDLRRMVEGAETQKIVSQKEDFDSENRIIIKGESGEIFMLRPVERSVNLIMNIPVFDIDNQMIFHK